MLHLKASQQLVCSRVSPLCPPCSDVCLLNPTAWNVVIACARGANVLVPGCPSEHTDIPSLSQSTSKFLMSRAAVDTWVAAREPQGCLQLSAECKHSKKLKDGKGFIPKLYFQQHINDQIKNEQRTWQIIKMLMTWLKDINDEGCPFCAWFSDRHTDSSNTKQKLVESF